MKNDVWYLFALQLLTELLMERNRGITQALRRECQGLGRALQNCHSFIIYFKSTDEVIHIITEITQVSKTNNCNIGVTDKAKDVT